MKKSILFFVMFVIGMTAYAQVKVTFRVNMSVKIQEGAFTPGTDKVVVRGGFQVDAGDTGDWQGTFFEAKDPDGDKIYTVDATFPSSKVGTDYEFKFVKAPDGWESVSNRKFKLAATNMTLDVYFFDDDQTVNILVTNIVTFQADLTSLAGTGVGFFDTNVDSIEIRGFANWEGGSSEVISGQRKLFLNQFLPGVIYETVLTVKGDQAVPAKWKFKCWPDARWSDGGWEVGADRLYNWNKTNNALVTVGPTKPNVFPLADKLTSDQKVLFQVDMSKAANVYDKKPIPLSTLQFVGLKGAATELGAWGGNWVAADTLAGMIVLNDKGKNGDKVANDKIWSREVTFKSGTQGGGQIYKYGAQYPGVELASASAPMDNEAGFGVNHTFLLRQQATRIEVLDTWLTSIVVSVDLIDNAVPTSFNLAQNYPNPFNPTTKISYTVPEASQITLKVFNVLGQEVATLVNTQQSPGTYEVNFTPYGFSSGIYLYTISNGTQTITKKMLLMK